MSVEKQIYELCLQAGIPYFGPHLQAVQGNPRRHIYMAQLVSLLGETKGGNSISVLEVGSWAGGSAITWANSIKSLPNGNGTVLCLDLWEPYFEHKQLQADPLYQEMNEAATSGSIFQLFQHNIRSSKCDDIVFSIKGPSRKILPLLAGQKFDIIFVDGDHSYQAVKEDLRQCMPLVSVGGVLCGDDLEAQMDEIDENHTREFIAADYIQNPKSGTHYHPGVTLAVGELFGPVSSAEGFWFVRRAEGGWEKMSLPDCSHLSPPFHLIGTPGFVADYLVKYLKTHGVLK